MRRRPPTLTRVLALRAVGRASLCVVLPMVAVACASPEATVDTPAELAAPPTAPLRQLPDGVAPTDWASAETVTVRMTEFRFTPNRLEFEPGRPYHLRLVNEGERLHTFSSPGFFRAVALRAASAGAEEDASPVPTVVPPGGERVLSFVVLDRGSYPFECSMFLHDVFGMTGEITVR